MSELIIYFIIFIIIEFIEASWQKESSLSRVLFKNYQFYKERGLFLFLIMNSSFFYTLFLAFKLNNFSFWLNSIIVMKFLDISLKLYLFQKIDREGREAFYNLFLEDMKMEKLTYINMVIYVTALFFALFLK